MVKKPKHLRPQPRKSSLTTHAFTFLILALFSILILLGLGILSLPSTRMISSRPTDFTTVERTSEGRESTYGDDEGNGERWLEVISWEPRAFLYHNFLTNEECEHLISLAKPNMAKSKVADVKTGRSKDSRVRTSSGAFLKTGHDEIVKEIEDKISDFTFIPVDEFNVKRGGQRVATVLMYLSEVEEGGETVFPLAKGNISDVPWWNELSQCGKEGLSVLPKKRDALLFWSMRPDGSLDPSSLHGGCPVIRGNKWSSTKWLHAHEYSFHDLISPSSSCTSTLTCNMEKVDASLRFPHERWPEVISMKPRAFLYHNFLKNEECEHLISLAKPYMRRSLVSGYGGGKQSSARTSTGSFISRGHDKIVEEIERRISEFTFLPVENGEGLQVIHYEVGQKFDPHFDGLGRIATFLMYLSDVNKGGETDFPNSSGGLSVSPKKGDAVLFWNNRPDGSQDPSSFHSGRPVIKGNKWAATKWTGLVGSLHFRVGLMCNVSAENGESLQVLHYEVGQKYEPHHDYFKDELKRLKGRATINPLYLILLIFVIVPWWNELSQCGKEGLYVLPLKRGALLFWSMKPDGSLDPSSMHECEHLISLAKPNMVRSIVSNATTGVQGVSSARTSTGSFISRGHDKIVEEIENRISEFTFLPVENGEGLRVIHYEVGQKFDPHFDGLGRIATFLMYLSDVDEGGETVFPMSSSGLSVSPKKGDAVLFWNNRPDGSQDPSSLHGER
ncbi:hypothetical protein HID58_000264 [Brassica napus]|uniref:Fe2OG dioxygenase domain-containing protein n=1 Tax=Brassica napus TaxID=3708 RepID=A0ABQ8EH29_BRANA|nr:hypothetical protein HID58_000264 [Brassica napus]